MNKDSKAYWKAHIFQAEFMASDGARTVADNWTMRVSHGGLQRKITLASPDRLEAAGLASTFYRTLKRTGSWVEAERAVGRVPDVPGGECNVGEWIKAVTELNILKPRTLGTYSYALRWFSKEHLGASGSKRRFDGRGGGAGDWHEKLDAVRLIDLTPERTQRIVDRFTQSEGNNPLSRRRAAVSVRSFVRNAKALFSRGIIKRLPCPIAPLPFANLELPEVGPLRYTSNIDIEKLLGKAREDLKKDSPALWIAFLLAFAAGLRRREMDTLTWTQVRFDEGAIWIRSTETFDVKTDGSEGNVFVDDTVMAELRNWQNSPHCTSEYVIPGLSRMPKNPSEYRCKRSVFVPLLKWLREHGVDGDKPIHILRKEFGSYIAATADIHVAQKQLRHSQISTTASYYAENRRRIAPGIGLEPTGANQSAIKK